MSDIKATCYGIHAFGGVRFLLQTRTEQSLYEGIGSPFNTKYLSRCPHNIDLDDYDDTYHHLMKDPLMSWFALPKGAVYVRDIPIELIEALTQLYSPVDNLISLGWGNPTWRGKVSVTNLAPWVLMGASSRDMHIVEGVRAGAPRPVLLMSSEPLPIPQLTTKLSSLPDARALRQLGAWAVRQRLAHKDPTPWLRP